MPFCPCHPCQMHRIASIGADDRARVRIAERACTQGIDPEDLVCRLIDMGLNAMDEADSYCDAPHAGNVVSLHRRAR